MCTLHRKFRKGMFVTGPYPEKLMAPDWKRPWSPAFSSTAELGHRWAACRDKTNALYTLKHENQAN